DDRPRPRGLLRIVADEETDEDVGINRAHGGAPRPLRLRPCLSATSACPSRRARRTLGRSSSARTAAPCAAERLLQYPRPPAWCPRPTAAVRARPWAGSPAPWSRLWSSASLPGSWHTLSGKTKVRYTSLSSDASL